MSSISAVFPLTGSATAGTTPAGASTVPQKVLGQNDFLKLLAKQFQMQDPMKPVEDTAFIAQMAQFTSLQQSSTMAQTMAAMRGEQQRATANSYLGFTVTINAGQGARESGAVSAIDSSGAEPQLVVNGKSYPLSAVLYVERGVVTPSPPPSTGGS